MKESIEESHPFLGKGKAVQEKNQPSKIRWLKLNRWSKLKFFSLPNQDHFLPHFVTFFITSCLWAAVVLSILRQSPQNLEQPVYPSNPRLHETSASFLASETEFLTCGRTVEEAKSMGCQYDILTNHWLPSQCTDEISIREYQSDGSWFPYADEQHTQRLAIEELGDLPFYYTSMRDHIVHCANLWKRQFRAMSEGWKHVDSITIEEEHTIHCSDFLMKKAELPEYLQTPIKVFVGKSGCHIRDV